ncbi:MAG: MerR family transcriptional regulator [Nitrospirota bacterium]|jgi:DNA-binding transcriptional MerR regulator
MEKGSHCFTPMEVVEIVGVTKRQLQHWDKTGLVSPRQRTPGGHARYTFQDLIALKTVKRLLDAGVSLQKIRGSVGRLRQILPTIRRPLVELTLVASENVVLVIYEETAFEALTGQEWIIDVAELQRDVDRWHYRLGPSTAPPGPTVETSGPVGDSRRSGTDG